VRDNFATLSIKATSAHTLVIVFFVNTHQGIFKNWKKEKPIPDRPDTQDRQGHTHEKNSSLGGITRHSLGFRTRC
jgi:hypothetical protein